MSETISAKESIICGLANLGNTCYLNSIVQILANQEALVSALFPKVCFDEDCSNRPNVPQVGHRSMQSFRHLLDKMKSSKHDDVRPSRFLHDIIALNPYDFSVNQQADASELLLLLLSKWEESFSKWIFLDKLYHASVKFGRKTNRHNEIREAQSYPSIYQRNALLMSLHKFKENWRSEQLFSESKPPDSHVEIDLNSALLSISDQKILTNNDISHLHKALSSSVRKRSNAITQLFEGNSVSMLTCAGCHLSRITYPEDFLVLSLPIPEESDLAKLRRAQKPASQDCHEGSDSWLQRCANLVPMNGSSTVEEGPNYVTLHDCFRMHCSPTVSEIEESTIKCPFCRAIQHRIQQQTLFLSFPEVLIISFKRFRFDGSWISAKGHSQKIGRYVHCPENIDLSEFCAGVTYINSAKTMSPGISSDKHPTTSLPPHTYTLNAVVNHHGYSLTKGHYTCYAYKKDLKKWALFNDHHVGEVPLEEVLDSEVYIAVYHRDKISDSAEESSSDHSTAKIKQKSIYLHQSSEVSLVDEDRKFMSTLRKGEASNVENLLSEMHKSVFEKPRQMQSSEIDSLFTQTTSPKVESYVEDTTHARDVQIMQVLVDHDASHNLRKNETVEKRLLNIEWLQRTIWLSDPGPITNLPCYCCPDPMEDLNNDRTCPINENDAVGRTVSQMDRVFSSLCENMKMPGLRDIKKLSTATSHHSYFRGPQKTCHGKNFGEVYIEIPAHCYKTLQCFFGGGPELSKDDLQSMTGG